MIKATFMKLLPKNWRDKIKQRFLTRASKRYIEGTPGSDQILRRLYPDHLYDKLRRTIAIELAGKEIAKVIDAESNQELIRIRRAVENMYDKREDVYAPIHDFWSLIEMTLHIKKKELPELLTAENMRWSIKDLPLDQLELTWMPFLTKHEDAFGKKPWKISELKQVFSESPELLAQAKQYQARVVGDQQHKFDQSDEPITILRRGERHEMIDGNGRLYQALLTDRQTIKCYVGTIQGSVPVNYWMSSGAIKQLCLEIRGYADTDPEGYVHGINYLKTKLRNNPTALINYHLYLRDDFSEFEEVLADILPER